MFLAGLAGCAQGAEPAFRVSDTVVIAPEGKPDANPSSKDDDGEKGDKENRRSNKDDGKRNDKDDKRSDDGDKGDKGDKDDGDDCEEGSNAAAKLAIDVTFLSPAGKTVSDATGLTFITGGGSIHENKVYDSSFWGTYPLYFVGTTMNFDVSLTNLKGKGKCGNKPIKKLEVDANSFVLGLDGSEGAAIGSPSEWKVDELAPGQTVVFEGVVSIGAQPSGLDVTRVRVYHNKNKKNPQAGLLKEHKAVWCPPDAE